MIIKLNYYQRILEEIQKYNPENQQEKDYQKEIIDYLTANRNHYLRKNPEGHLTASAWIINFNQNKVLLHHHQSLDKWIQLGGHLEKEELLKEAALREAREESGLSSLLFVKPEIFDLDVHLIPAAENKAKHFHYDIRYLFKADSSEELEKSRESLSLSWIDLEQVNNFLSEESILRMVRKTRRN